MYQLRHRFICVWRALRARPTHISRRHNCMMTSHALANRRCLVFACVGLRRKTNKQQNWSGIKSDWFASWTTCLAKLSFSENTNRSRALNIHNGRGQGRNCLEISLSGRYFSPCYSSSFVQGIVPDERRGLAWVRQYSTLKESFKTKA